MDRVMPLLLFVVVVGVFGATTVGLLSRADRRRAAMRAQAKSLGLRYTLRDPFGIKRIGVVPLGFITSPKGVLHGEWEERRVILFDVFAASDRAKQLLGSAVTIVKVRAAFPDLSVGRFGLKSVLPVAGAGSVDLESGAFNTMYGVWTGDRLFAVALLDATMMQWLLDAPEWFLGFFVHDGSVLVVTEQIEPERTPDRLSLAVDLVEQIPRAAWSQYGTPAG